MTLFPLLNEEKARLKLLAEDKAVVFALKKLFLNTCFDKVKSNMTHEIAAERLAQEFIKQAFYDLENISPREYTEQSGENPAV